MKIGVTGHRYDRVGGEKLPNPQYNKICYEFERVFLEHKPNLSSVLTGMAVGSDQFAAHVALRNNIPVSAILPFKNQDALWSIPDKNRYQRLLDRCFDVVIIHDSYIPSSYQERNKYIVNNCDILVAVFDGVNSGGTFNTIKYAYSQNFSLNPSKKERQLIIISPDVVDRE